MLNNLFRVNWLTSSVICDVISFCATGKCKKNPKKSMKGRRKSPHFLNDFRNFNEICRKNVVYDDIKSHKNTGFRPLPRKHIFETILDCCKFWKSNAPYFKWYWRFYDWAIIRKIHPIYSQNIDVYNFFGSVVTVNIYSPKKALPVLIH